MEKIKIGDFVTRNSYGNDVLFCVDNIIKSRGENSIAILKGVTLRIEASAYIEDLRKESKEKINRNIQYFEDEINLRTERVLKKYSIKNNARIISKDNKSGIILHLDGDKKYAEKSAKVYERFNLKAIVKNIKENRQPFEIANLLNRYNPDIVVITGHDGMIKKGYKYNDIYNYRNSRYFVRTVEEIRRWEQGENELTIFAGACQSYYEAIMEAGANFASSPARILIDFMDPLIIARSIAIAPESRFISIADISQDLRDGERGVGGIGSFGKMHEYLY